MMKLTQQECLILKSICQKAIFKCFNCLKAFSGGEMKSKEMDSGDISPQCPHCGTVVTTGFHTV